MGTVEIKLAQKPLRLHKAIVEPAFGEPTILAGNAWDYVSMWLKRNKNGKRKDALYYWEQARCFFEATQRLPNDSACLTAYYCMLNATKALLSTKGKPLPGKHGVTGKVSSSRVSLVGEQVTFSRDGILAALRNYLLEPTRTEKYSIKDLFYNLPYIHRAFRLTYSSSSIPELFVPVENPRFVRKRKSDEAWFCFNIANLRYANRYTLNNLPKGYEHDYGEKKFVVRRKSRFKWSRSTSQRKQNTTRLINYHQAVRKNFCYIHAIRTLWYLKKALQTSNASCPQVIDRSSLTMTFAAMHRLSELARYQPKRFLRHFDLQQNWLLCEFIRISPEQFIDEVSSEITGRELLSPGSRPTS